MDAKTAATVAVFTSHRPGACRAVVAASRGARVAEIAFPLIGKFSQESTSPICCRTCGVGPAVGHRLESRWLSSPRDSGRRPRRASRPGRVNDPSANRSTERPVLVTRICESGLSGQGPGGEELMAGGFGIAVTKQVNSCDAESGSACRLSGGPHASPHQNNPVFVPGTGIIGTMGVYLGAGGCIVSVVCYFFGKTQPKPLHPGHLGAAAIVGAESCYWLQGRTFTIFCGYLSERAIRHPDNLSSKGRLPHAILRW